MEKSNPICEYGGTWQTFIPNKFIYNTELSRSARFLFIVLKSFCSPSSPNPFPKVRTLSKLMGFNEDCVWKYLKELEDMGFIRRQRRYENGKRISNKYVISEDKEMLNPEKMGVTDLHPEKLGTGKLGTGNVGGYKETQVNKENPCNKDNPKDNAFNGKNGNSDSETDSVEAKGKAHPPNSAPPPSQKRFNAYDICKGEDDKILMNFFLGLFGRREGTPWTDEMKKKFNNMEWSKDDLEQIQWLHDIKHPYKIKTLATLLNNFPEEVEKAHCYKQEKNYGI